MNELELQGKTLEILRKKANKTQADGARIFGHGRSWLNDIEKGRLNITLDNGRRLVEFYGFNLNDYAKLYSELEKRAIKDEK